LNTWALLGLGGASLACYLLIASLSTRFVPGRGHAERPIVAVLVLLGVAHLLYLLALLLVRRMSREQSRRRGARCFPGVTAPGAPPMRVILGLALAFRLVQVLANPIQEVDIYRYLWDGRVALAGVNPYAYSPADVAAEAGVTVDAEGRLHFAPRSADGRRLADVLRHAGTAEVFRTVEHRHVPTVYPPLSQAVFALAAALTPAELAPRGQIIGMKLVFLLFDVGTIWLVVSLLRAFGRSPAWCLAYAWCPLVIKEVANSGHLDVVAVFFVVLAVRLLVRGWRYGGAAAWSAAVLTKVFPLVLLPILVRALWVRGGWRGVAGPLLLAGGLVAGAYALAWPGERAACATPLRGLRVFLTEWEMNDFLFARVRGGLDAVLTDKARSWLTRQAWWPRRAGPSPEAVDPAFALAYLLTGGLLAVFIIRLAVRPWPAVADAATRRGDPALEAVPASAGSPRLPEAVFAALAVMVLLSPAANPWYLLWAIPFLPWARQASWFLLPLVVLQYYLRFWFIYHDPSGGQRFFDEVWLWIEYVPFFAVLLGEMVWRQRRLSSGQRAKAAGGHPRTAPNAVQA
jgi:hypothetical protein